MFVETSVKTAPIRVSANTTKRKRIIFVHGFRSSAKGCWGPMINMLESDIEIVNNFEMHCFEYETFVVGSKGKIPSLTKVAEDFASFLHALKIFSDNQEITLVAHSMGGLVIQYYLSKMLQEKQGERLKAFRQVILFATPNFGSKFASGIRNNLLSGLINNPQEEALRVFSDDVTAIQDTIYKNIVLATERSPSQYPISFFCFYGNQDTFVQKASAVGHFLNSHGLQANHNTIKEPKSQSDENYRQFKDLLNNPAGHVHVFEVNEYKVDLQIRPFKGIKQSTIQHGRKTLEVQTDFEAHLIRRVTFSRRNICKDLFELRYTTRDGGLIEPKFSHPNEAPRVQQSLFKDYGHTVTFQFHPTSDIEYFDDLMLYKAFDNGNRHAHFHFDGHSFIKKYYFRLDLTSYINEGYKFADWPKFYFDPTEPPDHDTCHERKWEKRFLLPCKENKPLGIWKWEIENLFMGIVHIELKDVLKKNEA
ncbi:MAG: esterase/lipase family protein [Nitrospirales bacterium]